MNEKSLVSAAIRIIGLWRMFIAGGNALYFVIAKDLGVRTASVSPVSTDLFSLVFEILLGGTLILAAPFVAQAIYGSKPPARP